MIELACKDIVFHFNKKHLEDPTIPMWVLKTGGKTMYVHHVTSNVPWSTKETPDNSHTKGSIKLRNVLLKIDDENNADLFPLKSEDSNRLKKANKHAARIIIDGVAYSKIRKFIDENAVDHSPIKKVSGGCGSSFYITDIKKIEDLTLLMFAFSDHGYRELQPNEEYYKWYDDHAFKGLVDVAKNAYYSIVDKFSTNAEEMEDDYYIEDATDDDYDEEEANV